MKKRNLAEDKNILDIESMGKYVAGPIFYNYVLWILHQAQKEDISCLYFLARDGYILYRIAQQICMQFNLKVECRYLYCSRLSLRMPTYHLIGEEAYDILCMGGYYVTPKTILGRACLTEQEAYAVLRDINYSISKYNQVFTKLSLQEFTTTLRVSKVYRNFVVQKSRAAYPHAMSYLNQEGLFLQNKVVLVDSGWTGSMQRSLRQLMESQGYRGDFVGFYFGMYAHPKADKDGKYCAWYFDFNSSKKNKILFSNNLLECMLAAPHGMTTGYQIINGRTEPVMLAAPSTKEQSLILNHHKGVLKYVDEQISRMNTLQLFDEHRAKKNTEKLLYRYMAYPTKEEASIYGQLLFCDDVTESYRSPLAAEAQVKSLAGYSIMRRFFRKIIHQNQNYSAPELFWPYGTLAFASNWKRWWYRWNLYVWEWFRYTLK